MKKPKRKRITGPVRVAVAVPNDGTNSPVPDHQAPPVLSASEAALYQQADGPLGDQHQR